jgi:hypothetical protein
MFDEQGIAPSPGSQNATIVVVTKTVYQTATETATATVVKTTTVAPIATSTASPLTLDIPHHPKVDTAFTAFFGFFCLILITGLVFRKRSKKLKLFNIPLILGTFCKPHTVEADWSQLIGPFSPC